MQAMDLGAVFELLDNLHFNGRLRESGWKIASGLLHRGKGRFMRRERDSYAYVLHKRIWGLTMLRARMIIVDSRLLGEAPALRMVLLHEMVHAQVMTAHGNRGSKSAHGPRFVKELHRVASRGEECLNSEVRFYAKRARPATLRSGT
jgi:SprT-like family